MTLENEVLTPQVESANLPIEDVDLSDEALDEFLASKGEKIKPIEQKKDTEKSEPVKKEEKADLQQQEEAKKVDLRALQEERTKRKQFQKEATENKARLEEVNNLLKTIAPHLFNGQQAQENKGVTYEEDPVEYLRQNIDAVNNKLSQLSQAEQQRMQQMQAQEEERAFIDTYKNKAQEYAQTTPDFGDAYKFLMENRIQELKAFGYDDNSVAQIIAQEEKFLVGNAFQNGINPAESLYKIAQMRGFKSAQANPAPKNSQAQSKIEALQKGLDLNKSISNGQIGGKTLTEELNDDIDHENPFENLQGETNLDKLIKQMKKTAYS